MNDCKQLTKSRLLLALLPLYNFSVLSSSTRRTIYVQTATDVLWAAVASGSYQHHGHIHYIVQVELCSQFYFY